MKKKLKAILLVAILCTPLMLLNATDILAQEIKPLEKGSQVPDLTFSSLVNSDKEALKLSNFKDKLIILDFWATWCASCVAALPKLNDLQEKFKDKIQIIGITKQNINQIEEFYKQRKEKQKLHLTFPTAADDKVLWNYFPHQTISHMVWISKDGKIIGITGSEAVNEENIRKILNEENINLTPKTDRTVRADVDLDEPFILEKLTEPIYFNEGVTEGGIKYKSVITPYIPNIRSGVTGFQKGRIIATNVLLESLFMSAYNYDNLPTGEFLYPFPVNKFLWEAEGNKFYNLPATKEAKSEFRNKNISQFCYEIVFPEIYRNVDLKNSEFDVKFIALNLMKQDLMKLSGLTSSMQLRDTKVLVLRLLDSMKVVSPINYEKSEIDPAFVGGTFKDTKFEHFKRSLNHLLQAQPPLIDETDYFGIVNFKLDCKLTDPIALAKELAKFGLELKEEVRRIPLLVVSK